MTAGSAPRPRLPEAEAEKPTADCWRAAGLVGAVFTPLQPPTQVELGTDKEDTDYLSFKNHPFWDRKRASL